MIAINRIMGLIAIIVLGFFMFNRPQLVTNIDDVSPKWQYEMPVAWLEKRDEEVEYWLQNQKKK